MKPVAFDYFDPATVDEAVALLMSLQAFLAEHPDPTDAEIREAVSGNLCRCTGYLNIERAVKLAAARLRASPFMNNPR